MKLDDRQVHYYRTYTKEMQFIGYKKTKFNISPRI